MGDTASTGRTPVGAILAIAGGALLAIGSFLAWAEVSGGGTSVTAKGIDGSDGYITIGAGIVAVLVGILLLRRAQRALAILAILAILAGLVGGGVAVYDALTAKDSVLDAAAEELAPTVGATPEQVRVLLDQAIDSGEISISLSIGIYVVIAGGVLALVGGVLSLRGAPKEERAEAGSGWSAPAPSVTDEPPAAPAASPVFEAPPSAPPSAPPAPAPPPNEGAT